MSSSQIRRYESTSSLVKIVTALMLIHILTLFVSIGAAWLHLGLLHDLKAGVDVPEERIQSNDVMQLVVSLAYLLVFIVLAICYLRWIFRAAHNAQALVRSPLTITPGWCVGWFFIPILNLFKPFAAMKDIWRASISGEPNWRNAAVSPLVGGWWAVWIAGNFLGQASRRLSMSADDVPSMINSTGLDIAADALGVVLSGVALLLVQRIHNMQEEKSLEKFAGAEYSCPSCGEEFVTAMPECPVCGASIVA